MSAAFSPLAFVAGILVGAAGATWWVVRRTKAGAPASATISTLKVVSLTFVATAALTTATLYGVVRWKFRARPVNNASVDHAVEEFRASSSRSTRTAVGPAAGVYRYLGSGFYELTAPVLGKDRRDIPSTVPAVLVHAGNCWELTVRFFQQHSWMARYCERAGDGLIMEHWKSTNVYFGREVEWSFACTPANLTREGMKPGDSWKQLCKPRGETPADTPAKTATVEFVGFEDLTIGGKSVRARHIRRTVRTEGRQAGLTTRDLWFSETSGLLVRLRERSNSSGLARFVSDYQVTLAAATPTR